MIDDKTEDRIREWLKQLKKYRKKVIKKEVVKEFPFKPYVEIRHFIMDRFTFYNKMIFKNRDLQTPLKIYIEEMMDNTIFNLLYHMFGKLQSQDVILNTPKTWRDWIKQKHIKKKWMRWIIKKFPIKYNHHNYILNEYTTFPTLVLPPDFEKRTQLVFYSHKYEGVKEIEDDKDNDK